MTNPFREADLFHTHFVLYNTITYYFLYCGIIKIKKISRCLTPWNFLE